MFEIIKYPADSTYSDLCERPSLESNSMDSLIDAIYAQVKQHGDQALIDYTKQFENREITEITYSDSEIAKLAQETNSELQEAIRVAYANIFAFHQSQVLVEKRIETSPGVVCWQKATPIDKIGIYIPGGTAPLFSTILMLAIPAQIAGCKEIILCTPGMHPALFFAAQLCGVTKMCKIGGAQAIAALALGTASVPPVYKIFGPGNQYVTAAKMEANRMGIAIDMPAGPSEVAIFADSSANPVYVAADLLSQAEHGNDSQVMLISTDEAIILETISEIKRQLETLPRKDYAIKSLDYSKFILVKQEKEALEILNTYAAEHLILACNNPEHFSDFVQHAGSIFLGHYTPEAAGDYASGTNHTLPTNGFAHAYSGVNLDSFVKKITLQSITKEGLNQLGKSIVIMAEAESLQAHANAVKYRMD